MITLRQSGRWRKDILVLFWGLAPIHGLGRQLLFDGLQGQARHVLLILGLSLRLRRGVADFVLAQLGNHLLLSLVQVLQVSSYDGVLVRTGLLACAVALVLLAVALRVSVSMIPIICHLEWRGLRLLPALVILGGSVASAIGVARSSLITTRQLKLPGRPLLL